MFPTVYTLWKNPSLLPIVQTHPPVLEKLCAGADLMTPGLIGPPFPPAARAGRLVGIAGNNKPEIAIAVGICEIDVSRLERTLGEKGRAVRMVHWVGDEVYKYGEPGTVPNDLCTGVTSWLGDSCLENERLTKQTEQDIVIPENGIPELGLKEIDDAFYSAFLYGAQDYLTKSKTSSLEFPLSSSNFASLLIHPYLPPASHFPPYNLLQNIGPHPSLTIKKTSWKNVAKFLKYLEKEGLIKTKTRGGGEIIVLKIIWDFGAIQTFQPYRLPEISKVSIMPALESSKEGNRMAINSLYRPNGKAIKFFEAAGVDPKGYYTPTDLKQILNTYIETGNLAQSSNKRIVTLDAVLSNTLFTSVSPRHEKRDVLAENLRKSCSPYYTITTPQETTKPKSGNPPEISMIVENRQGKKTVTRIFGLEQFGIQPKGLAEELQKVCAGSATVTQAVGLKPGLLEVMVQGSQSTVVGRVLEKRGISPRWVGLVDKTRGKK
ncbi:hypothetical protein EDC01DRAFT_660425 [Geopyxis carbonaria]|nr:hypothetical protein EDC01DRAFT_660425 [Geopyxis carbonaria]